jgi:3-dehydroquinate synthase
MATPITVPVQLAERSYAIEIGSGNLGDIGGCLTRLRSPSSVIVISDRNVVDPYAESVVASLDEAGCRVTLEIVDPGEATKSVLQANLLWEALLRHNTDRKAVVVAVGGGVVGDLAGFVAAAYARGVALFQVPTTLLAQVDSSVGGKVGVNLPGAKNMVGAFWQPAGVLIDTEVLTTLPDREYWAGLAEVVKYGVILDADFFAFLESQVQGIRERRSDVLQPIVARCCELKVQVVQADEREETGLRAVLNYGHTFCHAIEAVTGYGRFLHGEAVAIGMLCASRLAESLGRIDAEVTDRQNRLLTALDLPTEVPDVDHGELIDKMRHDKKTEHGKLRFVLPTRMGHVELVDNVDTQAVVECLVTKD